MRVSCPLQCSWWCLVIWGIWSLLHGAGAIYGQQYTLNFSKSSTRMRWSQRLPSWTYTAPVRFAAAGDSTSRLRITASANMNSVLDERSESRNWQDNASVNTSVNYPILGPRASVHIGANMSVRSATLTKQKIRNQTFNFGFQFSPLQEGRFRSLRINVIPGMITASRANRANLDSTFQEHGIQYNATLRVQPELSVRGRKLSNSISVSKTDNTLKSNKNRSESYSASLGYSFPGGMRASLNLSENRSQVGIPRLVVDKKTIGDTILRDTTVSVALQRSRSSRASSAVTLKIGSVDVRTTASYRENLRTNTASADESPNNTYFGKDRSSHGWNFDTAISGKVSKALVARSALRYSDSSERFLPVRLPGGGVYRDRSSDLGNGDLFLNGSLDWQATQRHSLKLSAYVELKTEDNPGAPQQNRNIYSNSISLSYDGVTAGKMAVTARVERKYYHRINLAASRAADNLRNRDLTLSISTRYQRMGISFSHAFNISARRTIYDFDREINGSDELRKSNIRRGWSMVHTLRRALMEHVQVNARYAYSADDLGTLLVENGAQIVEEDNSDHTLGFGLSYNPTKTLTTSANYTYGLDRQWEHTYRHSLEERYLNRRNKSETFSMSANYKAESGTSLMVRGSRSRQLSGTFDSLNVTYSRPL